MKKPTFDFSDPGLWAPKFAPLLESTARKKVVYGSRGDGKSWVAAQITLMRLLNPNIKTRGLMVRKVRDRIKESTYQTLLDLVELYGWEDYVHFAKSDHKITAYNGNCMIALGMDVPGKAKSIPNPNFMWVEEADELTEEDYRQLSLSLRGNNVEEILTFNTPYEDHWLIGRFFPGTWEGDGDAKVFNVDRSFESADGEFTVVQSPDPNAFLIHGYYKQNPFCSENIIQDMEFDRVNFPEDYRRTGLGLIGRREVGSRWLKKFRYDKHVRKMWPDGGALQPLQDGTGYRPDLPVHLTYDQNGLPYMTQIMCQFVPVEGGVEVRILREYCIAPPGNSTEEVVGAFLYDFGQDRPYVMFYGEPAGDSQGARKTRNEAKHHYYVIQKELGEFVTSNSNKVRPSPPSINGRQRFMETILSGTYPIRIVIDPSCRNVIGDFEFLVEDMNHGYVKRRVTNKETGQSWEERGHCMDAIIYLFHQAFKQDYKKLAKV